MRLTGFTLIELLVAMGVTLALAGIALAIVVNTLGLWHRVQGGFSGEMQARLVFDLLERDLRAALHRGSAGPWLAVELQNSVATLRDRHGWLVEAPATGRIKPDTGISLNAVPVADADRRGGGIAHARFALGGAWLRLFSLDGSGLPVAVAYQLVRRPATGTSSLANPGRPHYLLLRTVAPDSLHRGWDIAAGYDDLLAAPAALDAVADGVVDFGVWFHARDSAAADGLRRVFPASASDTARYTPRGDGAGGPAGAYPIVADIMVRVLTDEGAALLDNLESGRGRSGPATEVEWWTLVETHSSVFVHRVTLTGEGL